MLSPFSPAEMDIVNQIQSTQQEDTTTELGKELINSNCNGSLVF